MFFNNIIKRGFTLIELLIVVAIIAILAAIAVPNFLEAQVRAKVSRTKSDMRTINTALETYAVDHNSYPLCHRFGIATRFDDTEPLVLERLSTPISYLSSVTFRDPFTIQGRLSAADAAGIAVDDPSPTVPGVDLVADLNTYIYQAFQSGGRSQTTGDSFQDEGLQASAWTLHSAGPDGLYHNLGGVLANDVESDGPLLLMYDPTNGTISFGSVYRAGGTANAGPTYAGGQGLVRAIQMSQ